MRVSFGDFALHRAARQLFRGKEELHLEPRAFELLCLLLDRRPQAVSKQEIRDRLWPDTFVSESNLTGLVAQIRHTLADDRTGARFVRTVHGFGYAFSGEAEEDEKAGKAPLRARVIWEGRAMALASGENVLGRDEAAAVQIDLPGVSRRHARIVIEEDLATLEDLGSKNGTFLRERRLETRAVLADGDTFRLGRHLLVYRSTPRTVPTRTEVTGAPRS
jgi:DNA-binding winged helix-turn-helix (wHTH) protein